MTEDHTDPEAADPMADSGISEDNYDEASWAGDSPLDDPEADDYAEDLARSGGSTGDKREREDGYKEDGHGGHQPASEDSGDSEYATLVRRNRRLQDGQTYRVGLNLDRMPHDEDWGEGSDKRTVLTSHSKPSQQPQQHTDIDWVDLPEDDPLLDIPFSEETKAREARERERRAREKANLEPLGMSSAWFRLREIVVHEWAVQRPTTAMVKGYVYGYDEYELSEPEFDAITALILDLLESGWDEGGADPDQLSERVRLAQGPILGLETRGGSRERGPARKARRIYPGDHLDAPIYHYDFTAAAKGKGKARRDEAAIADWLTGSLIVRNGRRWLSKANEPEFELDYWRSLSRPAANPELSTRVRELKQDGAYMESIARVLGKGVSTIKRMVK